MVALNKVHLDCTGARTSLIDWQIFMMQQSQNVFLAEITLVILLISIIRREGMLH